ncbi:unnamed protein product [Rotaria sordida]|uniref:Uncharacterized protein n=1 Tax=Rotaria sordida TaxID=392033 RepID=A0A815BLA3_9BILA|nr:unnamed protein product [Rotaria sordida]CAF1271667.1 unnamed protein product [Rotaria sordida]
MIRHCNIRVGTIIIINLNIKIVLYCFFFLNTAAKPPPILIPIDNGSHIIPSRPSTPPTDMDEEINKNRRRPPKTPKPHRGRRPDDYDESDSMSDRDKKKPKLVNESTQSDIPTRNVGTMHDPIKTRNFGNEVQPQSSSTQTSFPTCKKPPKPIYTFIERPIPVEPTYDESDLGTRICCQSQHIPRDVYYDLYDTKPHEYPPHRSPSPRQTSDYIYDGHYQPCCRTQFKDHPISSEDYYHCQKRRRHSPPSPPPPIVLRPITIPTHDRILIPTPRSRTSLSPPHRSRKSSPQYRSHTPTPSSHRIHYPSPSARRPRSATPRHRPPMHSQETDTSLDAMRKQHHTGVQYEPRSTQEKGTTPSIRIRKQPTTQRSTTFDPSICCQQKYSTCPKEYDHSQKQYYIQPIIYDNYIEHEVEDDEEEEDYEDEIPSMHDQSTMAELLIYLDHYTQCESQPFMTDRYIQTTPTADDNEQRNIYDYTDESFIRQLPGSGSICIHQPAVIQPDSLPRRCQLYPSPTRPKRDGLDYTGNNLEVSLHHGLQRVASVRDSPLLNISTENVINQLTPQEYVTPFETRFIYESDSSSTTKSRNNGSIILPVLNSARTHVFTRNSAHQSKSNGNFYLSNGQPSPQRSTNPSFRINITTDKS